MSWLRADGDRVCNGETLVQRHWQACHTYRIGHLLRRHNHKEDKFLPQNDPPKIYKPNVSLIKRKIKAENDCIPVAVFTQQLLHGVFSQVVVAMQLEENILSDPDLNKKEKWQLNTRIIKMWSILCLMWCSSTAKMVEADVEPFVHLRMDFMVMVADFSRSLFLFESLNFSGCTILISTAHVQNIWSLKSFETCVNIGRKHTTNDVTQMRNVIDVRKGWCD